MTETYFEKIQTRQKANQIATKCKNIIFDFLGTTTTELHPNDQMLYRGIADPQFHDRDIFNYGLTSSFFHLPMFTTFGECKITHRTKPIEAFETKGTRTEWLRNQLQFLHSIKDNDETALDVLKYSLFANSLEGGRDASLAVYLTRNKQIAEKFAGPHGKIYHCKPAKQTQIIYRDRNEPGVAYDEQEVDVPCIVQGHEVLAIENARDGTIIQNINYKY